jgi:ferredoxin-NADP reductase
MAEPPKFARVTRVSAPTPSVREIALAMVEPRALEYKAGQTIVLYAGFRDGKEIKRQYTLASSPTEEELRLCVKLIPGGAASEYLAGLKEGDQVTLIGPAGKCVLPEEGEGGGDLLFCATGTGIAPIRGMLLSHLSRPRKAPGLFSRLFGGGHKAWVLWGLREEADIFWSELFGSLAKAEPSFRLEITLSGQAPSWRGRRGRLTAHLPGLFKELRAPRVFLIGNGAMIKDARKLLEDAKLPKDAISTEAFFTPKAQGGKS